MLSELQLALADYRLAFPDLASLGTGEPPALWKAAYDTVRNTAFAPTLVTSTGSDGSTVGASRQFSQATLLEALHLRRLELDAAYTSPFDPLPAVATRSLGFGVILGCD